MTQLSRNEEPVADHSYTCPWCPAANNAMTAEWCSCVSNKPTLSCAACGRCFCDAQAPWRLAFFALTAAATFRGRSAELSKATPRVTPVSGEFARPIVLLVDDDRVVHLIAKRVLAGLPGTLLHAEDGQTALRLAMAHRPDVLITDALLPKLDGRELGRQIKTTQETKHCKVAVLTALYKGLRYRSEAFKHFLVDEYVEKPVRPAALRALVVSLLPVVKPAKVAPPAIEMEMKKAS